eukprot:NODE_21_length_3711_cov_51.810826_g19_i0.p1 GENE.NODE_21_length_3711_cov_51.810826_g19_i0~~NODE_21_length_3711_cov_51.810826_g19_i0.p1  ORF type:complete len:1219 (-),score=299.13 NODE_21_length_3711_cov_51.810826_g19_i0:54-3500(-)
MGQFILNSSTFVISIGYGFYVSWRLTLIILSVSPLLAIAGGGFQYVLTKLTDISERAYGKAGGIAQEVLISIRTVAAFNGQDRELERYKSHLAAARRAGQKKGWIQGGTLGFTNFVMFSTYGLAFYYGSYLIEWGYTTPGDIVGTFFAVLIGTFSLGMAVPFLGELAATKAAAGHIVITVQRTPEIDVDRQGRTLPQVNGNLDLERVTFRYPSRPEQLIFRDLNLNAQAGDKVALVGHSGGGKSSIISLLLRFYDAEGGVVRLDGVDVRELDLKWLRQQFGYVQQEPVLFSCSVAENLRLGCTHMHVTQEQIEQACKDANIHDTIMRLPYGYKTTVGEAGGQLSGGQRQRLCIARAILKQPKLLLLDEATSALDRQSEMLVQEALQNVAKARTAVVIAHRLVTIRTATQICFVRPPARRPGWLSEKELAADENTSFGNDSFGDRAYSVISERGTHDALMSKNGEYASMVHSQSAVDRRQSSAPVTPLSNPTAGVSAFPVSEPAMTVGATGPGSLPPSGGETGGMSAPPVTPVSGLGAVAVQVSEGAGEEIADFAAAEEETEEQPADPTGRIAKMSSPELGYILLGFLGAIGSGLIYPAYALIFADIITVFFKPIPQMRDETPKWCLLFLGLGVLAFFMYLFKMAMLGIAGERLTERLRALLFKSMLRQDISFFDDKKNDSGALCNTLSTECTKVYHAFGPNIAIILGTLATLIFGFTVAFIISWKLSLVLLTGVPLLILAGAVNVIILTGMTGKDGGLYAEANSIAVETVGSIKTVMAFNMQETRIAQYEAKLDDCMKKILRKAFIAGFFTGSTQIIMFGLFGLGFLYSATLIEKGELDFNGAMKAAMALIMSAWGVGESASMGGVVANAKPAAATVFKIIDREPPIDTHNTGGLVLDKVKQQVELRQVGFRYPARPETKVLRGLDMVVPAGKHVALIGMTGCGKSTCLQLLERFYDPEEGQVLIDGVDIKQYNVPALRRAIAVVSQEPVLFDDTVHNNIAYGKPDATEQEVEQAARIAFIHDTIARLADGYQTKVGLKGNMLSGGQRQRVAIARAVLMNPSILLLDEATAALDNESEKEVQRALDNIVATLNMTVFTIAHRLSTIKNVDLIAVIHEGVVIEFGSHEHLYNMGGEYRRRYDLYHSQPV